jgi:hypothetical protein
MNRKCDGEFFQVENVKMYRCLQDGRIAPNIVLCNGAVCPLCGRVIRGTHLGKLKLLTRVVQYVNIPNRGEVIIPTTVLPLIRRVKENDEKRRLKPHTVYSRATQDTRNRFCNP